MFVLPISLPPDKNEAYEYTDIGLTINFLNYTFQFEPWRNDPLYYYSHERMVQVIDRLNGKIARTRSWMWFLFISQCSYLFMLLGYVGMFTYLFIDNTFNSYLCALTYLLAFVHTVLCMVYRYTKTKQVTTLIENEIKVLNFQFQDERVHFKLINLNILGNKMTNILPEFTGQDSFALRVVYLYYNYIT